MELSPVIIMITAADITDGDTLQYWYEDPLTLTLVLVAWVIVALGVVAWFRQ